MIINKCFYNKLFDLIFYFKFSLFKWLIIVVEHFFRTKNRNFNKINRNKNKYKVCLFVPHLNQSSNKHLDARK